MARIGILTDFISHDQAYSLCNVVEDQLRMLEKRDVTLIVDECFEAEGPPWDTVPIRKLPGLPRGNSLVKHDSFDADLETMTLAMRQALDGLDVILTHDLIYQAGQILHNLAARQVATERPKVRWLHWIHSATPPAVLASREPAFAPAREPFGLVVYPNEYSKHRVAINFGYEEDQVVCVHHPTDVCRFLGVGEDVRRFVKKTRLLDADVVACYPVRLDRGKQVEFIVRIFAQLKRLGRDVRLVVVDFHSTGGDKVKYREYLRRLGKSLGLSKKELLFTSSHKGWKTRVPRSAVRDLMLLSDVFVQPSRSETYSLVVQEAAVCGNLLVLNFDFPPMRDVYGEKALYYKFGSEIDAMSGMDGSTNTDYQPNADTYCYDIAMRIAYELEHNLVLAQRRRAIKERDIRRVFKRELEPLLHGRGP